MLGRLTECRHCFLIGGEAGEPILKNYENRRRKLPRRANQWQLLHPLDLSSKVYQDGRNATECNRRHVKLGRSGKAGTCCMAIFKSWRDDGHDCELDPRDLLQHRVQRWVRGGGKEALRSWLDDYRKYIAWVAGVWSYEVGIQIEITTAISDKWSTA